MPAPSATTPPSSHGHGRRLAVRARLSRSAYLAGETVHGLVVVTSYGALPFAFFCEKGGGGWGVSVWAVCC